MLYPVGRRGGGLDLEKGSEADVASRAGLTSVKVDVEDADRLASKGHGHVDSAGAGVAVVTAAKGGEASVRSLRGQKAKPTFVPER